MKGRVTRGTSKLHAIIWCGLILKIGSSEHLFRVVFDLHAASVKVENNAKQVFPTTGTMELW